MVKSVVFFKVHHNTFFKPTQDLKRRAIIQQTTTRIDFRIPQFDHHTVDYASLEDLVGVKFFKIE